MMRLADMKPGMVDRSQQGPVNVAIDELIEARHQTSLIMARAQYALEGAEREIDSLRRQVIESHLSWYTEQELAAKIGCSKDKLARLRRERKIPCSMFGRIVRYSSLDELDIARIVRRPARPDAGEPQLALRRA